MVAGFGMRRRVVWRATVVGVCSFNLLDWSTGGAWWEAQFGLVRAWRAMANLKGGDEV